jgi:hypothetical protein
MLPKTDPLLSLLLDAMSEGTFSADLTFVVGGMLISGMPVSEKEFFQLLGEQFEEGWKKTGNEGGFWRSSFSEVGEKAQKWLAERLAKRQEITLAEGESPSEEEVQKTSEKLEALTRVHVHLKNVTAVGPGMTSASIPLWRGRLTEIAGWSLGRMSMD